MITNKHVGRYRLTARTTAPLAAATLVAAALLPASASAQVPSGVDRTLSNQNDLLKRVKPIPKQGQIDITVVDERRIVPPEQARKMTFVLRSLKVDGAVTVPESDLRPAWQALLGKTISLADLYAVADAIEARYRDAGYFSAAVIPSQDFESGDITVKLYETGFDEITIESEIPDIDARLAPYINRLLSLQPVPIAEVERILLLMSDLAGLDIEGVATRPQQPGAGGRMHLKISRTADAVFARLPNRHQRAARGLQRGLCGVAPGRRSEGIGNQRQYGVRGRVCALPVYSAHYAQPVRRGQPELRKQQCRRRQHTRDPRPSALGHRLS
jgi:hemolysin activation/secretion protein